MILDPLPSVIKWNLERNQLTYNPDLEMKMLSEEASEFFQAATLPERLQECADFIFVLQGTQAKFFSKHHEAGIQTEAWNVFQAIKEWASDVYYTMLGTIEGDLKREGIKLDDEVVVKRALAEVIEANLKKGSVKRADGKVVKGDDYVSPLKAINELVQRLIDETQASMWEED